DLEAAGIPYWDASGRVADFHCLRHSYLTALAKSNAPVKVVQTLARHSTPTLTLGVYAHVGLYDQAAALDALPDLSRPQAGPETNKRAATGTEGRLGPRLASEGSPAPSEHTEKSELEPRLINNRFGPLLAHSGDALLRIPAPSVRDGDSGISGTAAGGETSETLENKAQDDLVRVGAQHDANGGGGIRTHGQLAMSTVFKTVPINHSGTPPDPG